MRSRGWLVLCAVHGVASTLAWWAKDDSLQHLIWRSDAGLDLLWTFWTTVWVHSNTAHLVANQLALGLLVALAWVVRPDGWSTLAWCLAWPLVQVVLPGWPQVGHVVGLAGVLHAALAVLAVHLVMGRLPVYRGRRWGAILGGVLLIKLLLERAWAYPVVWDAANEMSVVQAAMLAGALWGALLGTLTGLLGGWVARRVRRP